MSVPKQAKIRGRHSRWGLLLAASQAALACGGMTAEDATGTGGADGADGAVSSGGTPGAGGTSDTGGAPAAGGAETGGSETDGSETGGAASDTGGTGTDTGGSSSGGAASKTACTSDSECVVTSAECCAGCEPISGEYLEAVNYAWDAQQPDCEVFCEACYEVPEFERTGAYFIAACQAGNCTLVDIRDESTSCNTGEDCILFDGNGCCQECDGSGYIAVSSFEFLGDRCDTVGACLPCESIPPDGLSAQCNLDTHRCEKVQVTTN